jgi:hypothetical protein
MTRLKVRRGDGGKWYVRTERGFDWFIFQQHGGRRRVWRNIYHTEEPPPSAVEILKRGEIEPTLEKSLTTRFGAFEVVCETCSGIEGECDQSKHEYVADCEREAHADAVNLAEFNARPAVAALNKAVAAGETYVGAGMVRTPLGLFTFDEQGRRVCAECGSHFFVINGECASCAMRAGKVAGERVKLINLSAKEITARLNNAVARGLPDGESVAGRLTSAVITENTVIAVAAMLDRAPDPFASPESKNAPEVKSAPASGITIAEALLSAEHDLRLSNYANHRWLVGNAGNFRVYERKPYARHARLVHDSDNEAAALIELLHEREVSK